MYPSVRLQRLKRTPSLRAMVSENKLSPTDFIMPIFVHEGLTEKRPIAALPGIFQHSLQTVLEEVKRIRNVGIKAVILFGIPNKKSDQAEESYNPNGIVQKAIRLIKDNDPDCVVIADCCLCEYTEHGHCFVMPNGQPDNDATLSVLQKIAISYAKAGADIIAPSGMMDGMIQAIRTALDENGFKMVSTMSYSVKYASAFYGPFREAAGSQDVFKGDRKHHQMNPSQRREAFLELEQDVAEGADILMVKPASIYMDIIRDLRESTSLPIAAYHVSGEYAALKAAAKAGVLNEQQAFEEVFLGLKRAGADLIISYFAVDYLQANL